MSTPVNRPLGSLTLPIEIPLQDHGGGARVDIIPGIPVAAAATPRFHRPLLLAAPAIPAGAMLDRVRPAEILLTALVFTFLIVRVAFR